MQSLLVGNDDLSVAPDFVSLVHVVCKHRLRSFVQDHFFRLLEETFERNGASRFWRHFDPYSRVAGLNKNDDLDVSVFQIDTNCLLVVTDVNVNLGSLISMALESNLILRTIGVSIPMKATFFMTYIMVDGWAGIAGEILILKPLVIYHLKNMFLSMRTLHILSRVLSSVQVNSRNNVTSMSIEATKSTSHIRPSKEKESWDLNTEEKLKAAGKKKEEGNVLFKAGKHARASKRYEKVVKYIEYDSLFGEEEKKQAKTLKVSCNLNNAACKLKLKDYKEAEKLCTKVLDIESTSVKALYRRAQAYMQLTDLDLTELDINKTLEIDPNNRYMLRINYSF
ncbi:Peptidyl-prolyl cis-trans isomerase FKBP62 [Glycine soja]|uniref:peptidylprolyl isomerase n=2 Tax=Glycine soja TaxID=3848 RepID=A0A445JVD3_GLYSO|nr:Peptidyl-prolyl cis-trans isomerase FKBP62 [Glycine soja]